MLRYPALFDTCQRVTKRREKELWIPRRMTAGPGKAGWLMELWDLLDEDRKPLGKKHVRGVPMEEGTYHVIVDIWTVTPDGRILLTQRHPDKAYGLKWECTGGSVLAGETSIQGVCRELEEEVGIHAEPEELTLLDTVRLNDRFVDTYINRREVDPEKLHLQETEVVGARLVTFEELCREWEEGKVMPRRFSRYRDELERYLREGTAQM